MQICQGKKIAYILGNFPCNIETFVLAEMKGLARIGYSIYVCPIHYIPLKDNSDKEWGLSPVYAEPFNLSGIILAHLFFIFIKSATYLRFLINNQSYGGKLVFLKSVYFAWIIKKLAIKHVHAHFAWVTTDSARIISRLADIPYSFTAHAADIYYLPDNLEEKIKEAKFILTCVKHNKVYIREKFGEESGAKVEVVYHGVDLDTFRLPADKPEKVVDVLSIGRLVEKKGFNYLIEAISILTKKGIPMKCLIIGEGPEKTNLVNQINELGLVGIVDISGNRSQDQLPSIYAGSKIFCLPSIITDSGDRDGIPNVLAEAMAMGLPVISSDLPNISELIENKKNGMLVREKDAKMLAISIEKLLINKKMREVIGINARSRIEEKFDAKKFQLKIAAIFTRNIN